MVDKDCHKNAKQVVALNSNEVKQRSRSSPKSQTSAVNGVVCHLASTRD